MTHPYQKYEGTALWDVIQREIEALIENRDLQLQTAPEYVIGSLCKALDDASVVTETRRP